MKWCSSGTCKVLLLVVGGRRLPITRRAVGRGSAGEPADRLRREVLVHVLGLAVLGETGRAEFAPDAALAEAAPLRLREVGVEVVDPDGAVPQPSGDAAGTARVAGR